LICSISLSSCYGFAGLRLHPLLVLHLALLVIGIASPVEQLLLFEKASPTQKPAATAMNVSGQAPVLAIVRSSMGSRCSTSGGWLLTPIATITW